MTGPTVRLAAALAIGVPPALALILWDQALWPVGPAYTAAVVGLFVADAIAAEPWRQIEIEAHEPGQIFVGDGGALRLVLSWTGWAPSRLELVCDVNDLWEPVPAQRTTIPPSSAVELDLPLMAKRRGLGRVERLWLRRYGPLGLAKCQRVRTLDLELPVVPGLRGVRQAAINLRHQARHGVKPLSLAGEGSEFEALRDYQPGFDPRAIDWKHSARHRALMCKEFRAERNHDILLAFDTGRLMSEPLGGLAKLDHAINAGLMLAYVSLEAGDRIGAAGFAATVELFTEPAGGLASFQRLRRTLAHLNYGTAESNFTLAFADLRARLARRSLVIVMTDFVDTVTAELMVDNLRSLSKRHLAVFVTARDRSLEEIAAAGPDTVQGLAQAVMADELLRERKIVFERLQRLGIDCVEAPPEQLGPQVIERYLAIVRRERL